MPLPFPRVGYRPMHQVEIDILQSELVQAFDARTQGRIISLIAVPEPRRHKYVLARQAAIANGLPHILLVAVGCGGVAVHSWGVAP